MKSMTALTYQMNLTGKLINPDHEVSMWKVGDKCNVISSDNDIIRNCEITYITPKGDKAIVEQYSQDLTGIVGIEDLICVYLLGNINNLSCLKKIWDKDICLQCPNWANGQSSNKQL